MKQFDYAHAFALLLFFSLIIGLPMCVGLGVPLWWAPVIGGVVSMLHARDRESKNRHDELMAAIESLKEEVRAKQ